MSTRASASALECAPLEAVGQIAVSDESRPLLSHANPSIMLRTYTGFSGELPRLLRSPGPLVRFVRNKTCTE